MEFTLKINCDNGIFENDPQGEISDILRGAADQIMDNSRIILDNSPLPLYDTNGNRVGEAKFTSQTPKE